MYHFQFTMYLDETERFSLCSIVGFIFKVCKHRSEEWLVSQSVFAASAPLIL